MLRRIVACFVVLCFVSTTILSSAAFAQLTVTPVAPGMSAPIDRPAVLKGIVIDANDPFKLDFIIQSGDVALENKQKQEQYSRLIRYFLASVTVPDTDQWVNLSPDEKDRIIADNFGQTEMGRDLLAQDYLLKQAASSLSNPSTTLGKKFWEKIYERAYRQYSTTDIPTDVFNRVWITPDSVKLYEKDGAVYVLESRLKVQLESDYLAAQRQDVLDPANNDLTQLSREVMREVILPVLEQEVNEGRDFSVLRQVYSGMLLAAWYKQALRESILTSLYGDKSRLAGIRQDPRSNEEIYQKYLEAFRVGAYNVIRDDVDSYNAQPVPRKYFSGGMTNAKSAIDSARRVSVLSSADASAVSGLEDMRVSLVSVTDDAQFARPSWKSQVFNLDFLRVMGVLSGNDPVVTSVLGDNTISYRVNKGRDSYNISLTSGGLTPYLKILVSGQDGEAILHTTLFRVAPSLFSDLAKAGWKGVERFLHADVLRMQKERVEFLLDQLRNPDGSVRYTIAKQNNISVLRVIADEDNAYDLIFPLGADVTEDTLSVFLQQYLKNLELLAKADESIRQTKISVNVLRDPDLLGILAGVVSADRQVSYDVGRTSFRLENVVYPALSFFYPEDFQQNDMSPDALLDVLKTQMDITPAESGDPIEDLNQLLADESFRQKIAQKVLQDKNFVWPDQMTRQERTSIQGRMIPDQRLAIVLLKALFSAVVPYKATSFDVEVYNGMTFVKLEVSQNGYRSPKLMDVTLYNPSLSRLTDLGWGGVARLLDTTLREARIKLMDDFLALARKNDPDLVIKLDHGRLVLGIHAPRTQWIDFDVPAGELVTVDDLDGVIARTEAYRHELAVAEADASAIPVRNDEVGGIDLAQKHLDMQILRDGNGVPLPVAQQDFSRVRLDGLEVCIEFIRPVTSLFPLTNTGSAL